MLSCGALGASVRPTRLNRVLPMVRHRLRRTKGSGSPRPRWRWSTNASVNANADGSRLNHHQIIAKIIRGVLLSDGLQILHQPSPIPVPPPAATTFGDCSVLSRLD